MILCCYNVVLKDLVATGRFTMNNVIIVDGVTNITIHVSKRQLRFSLETLLKEVLKNSPLSSLLWEMEG